MSIRPWLVALACCASVSHAQNLDWQYIDQSPEYQFFIKPATVQAVTEPGFNSLRQIWARAVVNQQPNPEGLAIGDYMVTLFWVNCNEKLLGVNKGLFFSKAGKPMFDLNFTEKKVQMEPAQTGSMNDKIVQQTCAVAL